MSVGISRIGRRFETLAAEGRAGLVAFVTAGDPDAETSAEILAGLAQAGADVIELGMPFSDPMADGPAIQAASVRALAGGETLAKTLAMLHDFRKADDTTPVVLMGYFNPIYAYGIKTFVSDAAAAGADGLIVVDLPPEEDTELLGPASAAGLNLIRLATPTTDAMRLPAVLEGSSGFLYYVSVAGITGTKSALEADVAAAVARLKARTDLPIAVGFGIKTPEQAASVARVADGVVVGSAIVEIVARNLDENGQAAPGLVKKIHEFVASLAAAVRAARRGDQE